MANLNWVDFIFLAIFFFSMIAGFTRGFVKEMVSLASLIAAFVIAISFSSALASYLSNLSFMRDVVSQSSTAVGVDTAAPISYVLIGVSFAILFSGTVMIGSIIGFFLNTAFATGILGFGNRILGGLFGLIRGYILNLVIIFVIQLTPLGTQAAWHQSKVVQAYQPAVLWLGGLVSPSLANLKNKLGETFHEMSDQIQGAAERMNY